MGNCRFIFFSAFFHPFPQNGIFPLQRGGFCDISTISLKCVERENSGTSCLREGRSSAASRPVTCRLVRPGAARESGTGSFPPLPKEKVCAAGMTWRRECGWSRGRVAFRPRVLGGKAFLLPKTGKDHSKRSFYHERTVSEHSHPGSGGL